MTRTAFLLPLAFLFFLTACDSSGSNEPMVRENSIDGNWVGEVTSQDLNGMPLSFAVDMTIAEDRSNVTGSGTVTGPDGAKAFTLVEGSSSYLHPIINFDLLFDGPPLGELNGAITEDLKQIRGTMSGPGFAGIAELEIVLSKRPQ